MYNNKTVDIIEIPTETFSTFQGEDAVPFHFIFVGVECSVWAERKITTDNVKIDNGSELISASQIKDLCHVRIFRGWRTSLTRFSVFHRGLNMIMKIIMLVVIVSPAIILGSQ